MYRLRCRKIIVVVALSGSILISSFTPAMALESNAKNEVSIEQSDSTSASISSSKQIELSEKNKRVQEHESSSNLAYNIIYYLISIFIKTNPLSRPG